VNRSSRQLSADNKKDIASEVGLIADGSFHESLIYLNLLPESLQTCISLFPVFGRLPERPFCRPIDRLSLSFAHRPEMATRIQKGDHGCAWNLSPLHFFIFLWKKRLT